MAGLTDRQRVEHALPAYVLLGVLMQGADDKDAAQVAKEALLKAASEPLLDLVKPVRDKLSRRIARLHDLVTKPYREQRVRIDKFGLITFYAIGELVDRGQLELHEGSALQKALELMAGALLRAATDTGLEAEARQQVPKFLSQLRRLGYYGGTKIDDRSVEQEASRSARPRGAG
jgi:hypothetical protein